MKLQNETPSRNVFEAPVLVLATEAEDMAAAAYMRGAEHVAGGSVLLIAVLLGVALLAQTIKLARAS